MGWRCVGRDPLQPGAYERWPEADQGLAPLDLRLRQGSEPLLERSAKLLKHPIARAKRARVIISPGESPVRF